MDLSELYSAVADGSATAFLQEHPEYVSREVAERARRDVRAAVEAGRPDIVAVVASAEALVYLGLGVTPQALRSRLDALQAFFALDDTEAAYDSTRSLTLGLAHQAQLAALPALVFRCWVLAGDCSWFAAITDGAEQSQQHLIQALRDVALAGEVAARVQGEDWGGLPDGAAPSSAGEQDQTFWEERLASLTAVVAGEAMSRVWDDEQQAEVDAWLRWLARVADEVLPVELRFEADGGAEKVSRVSAALAELVARYGRTA